MDDNGPDSVAEELQYDMTLMGLLSAPDTQARLERATDLTPDEFRVMKYSLTGPHHGSVRAALALGMDRTTYLQLFRSASHKLATANLKSRPVLTEELREVLGNWREHLRTENPQLLAALEETERKRAEARERGEPEHAPTGELEKRLENFLAVLTDDERNVINLRVIPDDGDKRSVPRTAKKLGMTRDRVRQLEQSALQKIRARGKYAKKSDE